MRSLVLILLLAISSAVYADNTIRIAVAANFFKTLKAITKDFTQQTGIKVLLSNGSTGMLYAQIKRGAPYDMFFAGDSKHPGLLEEQGYIAKKSRFTYAVGKLVVWSPDSKVSTDLSRLKGDKKLRFIAIANPKTAPYGIAAITVLKHYGLYKTLKQNQQIAYGENIGATYHFVASGNAQIGLVAKSYVVNISKQNIAEISQKLYPQLKQQAVVLKGKNSAEVKKFMQFFNSDNTQKTIQTYGYGVG